MAPSYIDQKRRDRVKNATSRKELKPSGQVVAGALVVTASVPAGAGAGDQDFSIDLAQQYLAQFRNEPSAVIEVLESAEFSPDVREAIRAWLAKSEHTDAARILGQKRAASFNSASQSFAAKKLADALGPRKRSQRARKAAQARWARR